jgi:phosphoribosylanthranilate isomerase
VAVTQHPSQDALDEILRVFRPDVLQTDAPDLLTLRLPDALEVLPVVRARNTLPASLPPRLLFEGELSGTGQAADWSTARSHARQTELVLAGGLDADNVAVAIEAVEPFGVDVSSGVEERPGVKSPRRILQFVSSVRAAAARA